MNIITFLKRRKGQYLIMMGFFMVEVLVIGNRMFIIVKVIS